MTTNYFFFDNLPKLEGELGMTQLLTFNYEYIHHIENVTQEFIDFLSKPFHVNVFITPYISNPPRDKVSTNNDVIVGNITGKVVSMKSLRAENTKLKSENERLVKENNEFRAKLGMPIPKAKLEAAKTTDKKVNG